MPLEFKLSLDKILSSDNLAADLNDEQLRNIEAQLSSGIKADLQSREGWEQDADEWVKLAAQVREQKSYPWKDASNVKYPILTIASMQFAARAYPALLSGPKLVNGRVIGYDPDGSKARKASRISKHMSYQVRNIMKGWERDMDRLLHALPLIGTAFKKTYFDPLLQRNVSELVNAKELVVNYYASSLEDAERKTHILYYTSNQVQERITSEIFIKPKNKLTTLSSKPRKVNADATQNLSASRDDKIIELYECHCYLDLDGDGYEEPYIVTIHSDTMQILRIFRRFGEVDIVQNEAGNIIRISPKEYFTSYIFIPDPNSGVYGLGFGSLLGPLNLSINTLVNQLIDAGTLNNMQGGFLSSSFQISAGDLDWEPGEWKIVNSYGNDIRQGIVPLPSQAPSSVLFNLLNMLEGATMRIASVTDILSGEVPGQNTKATVAMNAVEQGLKLFSSIYKRCHASLSEEMMKCHALNAEFLQEEEYLAILDKEEDGGQKVTRDDYNTGDYDIVLSADPNVSSDQQRITKVQALFDIMQLGHVNPMEVTKQYLEATDQPNIEALMTMPPPPGPPAEIVLAQQELAHKIEKDTKDFEHRQRMDYFDRELRSIEVDLKGIDTRVGAILDIAKAEGEEEGRQLGEYRNYLDQISKQEEVLIKKKNAIIDQKLKEEQMAIARKQEERQAQAEAAAAKQQQQNQG